MYLQVVGQVFSGKEVVVSIAVVVVVVLVLVVSIVVWDVVVVVVGEGVEVVKVGSGSFVSPFVLVVKYHALKERRINSISTPAMSFIFEVSLDKVVASFIIHLMVLGIHFI